jgi:hypothetical protein
MPEGCRVALERFTFDSQNADMSFPVHQAWVKQREGWAEMPPLFIPADPTAIVAEAARLLGGTEWSLLVRSGRIEAWAFGAADSPMGAVDVRGPDPMTAALRLFQAAWERVNGGTDGE